MDNVSGWSAPPVIADSAAAADVLQPGRVLGNRYEILQLLGEGGMGAVYKALDREVERVVALKVIRPELARNADVLRRFKQELILARQVTHRNVIRIFDLGEADGVKFITMEFIEGVDLKTRLKNEGKFEPAKAAEIIKQVCQALEAAHMEGVIHRDLKPQNVMIDSHGKVSVMDFGIARGAEASGGMTQTGALVGTPEYMSPEQAKGEKLDARSDLFSLGIIFYELLTGDSPYKAETAMASLYKRTREPARPPIELNPAIPRAMSDVVVRCLAMDKEKRYASATEILRDLSGGGATRPGTLATMGAWPSLRQIALEKKRVAWVVVLSVVVLVAIGYGVKYAFRRTAQPGNTGPSVSLAILPFGNSTGDAKLDWLGPSMADMLSTDVGQSAQLRTVSPDRVQQIMRDLQLSADSFSDVATVRRVADMSNADTVVWGHYAKFGDQIRVDATLLDIKHDRNVSFKVEGAADKDVFVDQLAQAIRNNLALRKSVVDELKAQAFKPTSTSAEAIRFYSQGNALARAGKNLEALSQFQQATQADQQFALAYAKLAETYANLGQDAEAEQASRKAVELSESLPTPEKYLIAASHARIMRDYPKAIAAYENLAKAAPGNVDFQYVLGTLYEDTGDYQKAREHYAAVLKADPQSVEVLWKMGGVEIMSDNPQGSLDYLNRGLTLSIQLGNDEKRAVILQAMGIAYRLMNKPEEALRNYQQALAIERQINFKRGVAASLHEMALVYSLLGKQDAALASFNEAIQIRKEIGAKKEAGDTLIDLGNFYENRGQHDLALKMFMESLQVQRDAGDRSYEALCLNNIGTVYLTIGQYDNALTYFQQALQLREKLNVAGETVETVYNLGQTNSRLGQYDQALTYYVRALDLYRNAGDKRGAAIDSYSMGALFSRQGRFGAAVTSEEQAVSGLRELKERSATMGEVLSGYGGALADAGRSVEAQKILAEALSLGREVKSEPVIAQAVSFQGDGAFYRGDFKSARALYSQALQVALHTKDRDQALEIKISVARTDIKEGRSREAIASLTSLAQEANSLGSKYLSVECSVDLGEALVGRKDYARARQELEPTLSRAEKFGLRALLARDHYLLAEVLRESGDAREAADHYREALRLLDETRKEAGAEKLLERADLKSMYDESTRWSQGSAK